MNYQYPYYYGGMGQTAPMYQYVPTVPQNQPVQTAPGFQQATAPQTLSGKFVDSIESVKATDVLMDGSIMFFPSTDGKTIYTKQLQSDGTSRILTFSAQEPVPPVNVAESISEALDAKIKALQEEISAGFEDINERFDSITRKIKGKGEKE